MWKRAKELLWACLCPNFLKPKVSFSKDHQHFSFPALLGLKVTSGVCGLQVTHGIWEDTIFYSILSSWWFLRSTSCPLHVRGFYENGYFILKQLFLAALTEVPGPGIKPTPQQQSKPHQRQLQTLNPLRQQGIPVALTISNTVLNPLCMSVHLWSQEPLRQVLSLLSCYSWENQGLVILPKATQLVSGRAGIWPEDLI